MQGNTRQRSAWALRSPSWRKLSINTDPRTTGRGQWLCDGIALDANHSVLDIAAGTGDVALYLASTGHLGRIVASDLVIEMLGATISRGERFGISGVRPVVCDMEMLSFDSCVFDRVICSMGIMFCGRPELALAEAFRVLRPNGKCGYVVWGDKSANSLPDSVSKALLSHPATSPFDLDQERFGMSAPQRLARGLAEAGFADIERREISRSCRYPNSALAPLVRSYLAIHHQSLLRNCSPQLVDQVVEQAAASIEGAGRHGQSELRQLELLFVANKPPRPENACGTSEAGIHLPDQQGD